jgi:hypothetical protein
MKDCILAIFWPRKDIVAFFAEHGCSKGDVSSVADFEKRSLSRPAIVDIMFTTLGAKADGGLGEFRAMLHALLLWSHFDPYYFGTLKKLDIVVARQRLEHLRQLQEIRDAKIQQERARRAAAEAATQSARAPLAEVRDAFLALYSSTDDAQKRGYSLEGILADLARIDGLHVTDSFRVNGEQIDGAVKFDGEHYLIEAKWQDKAASNEPLYQFAGKIEGKMYGRGLFVSVHGFSEDVVGSLTLGKAIKTVLVDGEDLTLVIEEQLSFSQLIDAKVKAAQTKGLIYVHPITGKSKAT